MKRIIYLLPFLLCFALAGCNTQTDYDIKSIIAVITISTITILFLVLAAYSNILRDEISNIDEFEANVKQMQKKSRFKLTNTNAPFNLTRVQFGIWTVIISSVYIYLSLFKGDCADAGINKTALVLMGIFAGTAVAGTLIDKKEINDNRPRHQNRPSQGFFIDILSDANGISLHRFQNFAWTIIAVIVYLYKVSLIKTGCDLPELSDTLLALTGISSATYLVMKTQENEPPSAEGLQPVTQTAATATTSSANGTTAIQPATV
ncbi:MAG TPA: hypothetical protein VFW07_18320 [Parafilimonas sp.]|nr:hypothetical protein [Parafilimonas sp.]